MSKSIDPKDIEIFLLDNPDFFVSREALLSELDFKHDSGNASSLLERQIKRLREEQNTLMDLLTSFVGEAKVNEDLFIKSKNLTLSILEANDDDEVTKEVVNEFTKNFGVDKCLLRFFNNSEIAKLEDQTELSLHKGAIHCGSFSSEKLSILFDSSKIESAVIAVLVHGKKIGVLQLGSYERTKYLGDEDTTFIEYVRDVLEKRLSSLTSNE
ncbi:DUF484 family protein [Gammaproteobacteria bacterium]|jgi:uncharacterized protein YigA (DUF484 family)|nr:DUF484 family protein [Gammaproteobacteria bacterium]|tara:strand:- start:978 stop:1613 length:636 start_codon:yes stop_codon:yes gene_type:complete